MKYKFLNTWSKFMTIVVVLLTASASAHAGLIYQYTFTHTYNNVQGTTTGKIYGLEDNTTGQASNITMETYNSDWLSGATSVLNLFNGYQLNEYTMANGVLTKFQMIYWNTDLGLLGIGIEQRRTMMMVYDIGVDPVAQGTIRFNLWSSRYNSVNEGSGPLTISAYAPLGTEVPEPSTLAIFALGLMALVSRRFKKQS
jgi:hypothetical protein